MKIRKEKKTNVKRLTHNEVALVAEMQSKIDFYERFLNEIWLIIKTKKDRAILEGDYSSAITGDIYRFVKEKINT